MAKFRISKTALQQRVKSIFNFAAEFRPLHIDFKIQLSMVCKCFDIHLNINCKYLLHGLVVCLILIGQWLGIMYG